MQSRGLRVVLGKKFELKKSGVIDVADGRLDLGLSEYGWVGRPIGGILNVRGRLTVDGFVRIADGSRIDIGPNGSLYLGDRTYFSPRCLIVIAMPGSRVGSQCAVSWDVQILDSNFHSTNSTSAMKSGVCIGDRVWIGCNAVILPGTEIADGCVVAAGSIVRGSFRIENSLIAGNPAKVVSSQVTWTP